MQNEYLTTRLIINELKLDDDEFILSLLNTPEWIKFIGDRNIRTKDDSRAYIQKIIHNKNINYWVARLQEKSNPIGVITFIKRDDLEHYDIGFAFLPQFTKKGYAFEATTAVLNHLINPAKHTQILATTLKENKQSIKLLEKLGLRFEKEIQKENELLLLFSISLIE